MKNIQFLPKKKIEWSTPGLLFYLFLSYDKVRLLKDSTVKLAVKAGIEFIFLTNMSICQKIKKDKDLYKKKGKYVCRNINWNTWSKVDALQSSKSFVCICKRKWTKKKVGNSYVSHLARYLGLRCVIVDLEKHGTCKFLYVWPI